MNELLTGGCLCDWEEKTCQLCRKVAKIVASQSCRRERRDISCAKPAGIGNFDSFVQHPPEPSPVETEHRPNHWNILSYST